jgi:hypothetical protein
LKHEDFDVFDGERDVGRVFQQADGASWFWGVSVQLTGPPGGEVRCSLPP